MSNRRTSSLMSSFMNGYDLGILDENVMKVTEIAEDPLYQENVY